MPFYAMARDMGRYGEIWRAPERDALLRDGARYGEIWGDMESTRTGCPSTRWREIWGDMGRYGEHPNGMPFYAMARDMGRYGARHGEIWGDMESTRTGCPSTRWRRRLTRRDGRGGTADARDSVSEQELFV